MADDEVVSEVVSSGPHRGGRVLRTPEERATKQSGESEAQRMQREEERMAQATREQVMEEIKAIIENEQLRVYAEETASRITQKTMQEKAAPDQFRGKENDPKTPLGKATSSKEAAQRILIAAKTGKLQELTTPTAGEPPVVNAFAAETIKKISDAVPVTAIGDNSGAFLFDLMNKMLRNEITDFDGLNKQFTNFAILVTADPYVYGRIAEAYKNIGRSYGLDDERLNRMYQTIDELRNSQGSVFEQDKAKDEAKFDYDRQRALANYIGDDEDDNRVIRALYSPQFFLEYVDYIKQIPSSANPEKYGAKFKELSENSPGSDEYWQEVSEILTREIAFRFGKVFRAVSKSHKDKFLDEIANDNPMESMNLAKTYLNQALLRLSDRFTDPKVREFYGIDKRRAEGDLRFFSKRKRTFETEKVINYTDVNGNAKSHTVIRDRRISVGRAQEVEIYDFLAGVKFQVERFIDHALPYNHNIQALFLRQAGQDGTFWGQIGQYAAANLTTFDLDSLNDIPDADIVMSAFRMYSKYVKADFAHYDWKNEPGRFTEEFDSPNTPIQQDVVKNLKKLFPELQDHHNKWRLDQAMNIAIGVSRGVFLTEPTTVAWADAPHTGEGNPTFESYYTNSNAALLGLNPQHNPDRWKTPAQTQGPLLHLPVAGEMPGHIRNFMKHWNHVKLYEWMKKRQNSYTQGLPAFTELHPEIKGHHLEPGKISVLFDRMLKKLPGGEARAHKKSHDAHGGGHGDKKETFISKIAKKLPWTETHQSARKEKWAEKGQRRLLTFIDAMPNIGKVGGPIERGGWRNKAYEGWVIYDANGKEDPIETFKALENIGVEAVKWWVENDGNLKKLHRGSGHDDGNFTDEFGEYVYNKYIKPNSEAQLSYKEYVKNVKKELVEKQGIKIKQEKADRGGDTTRQTKSQKKAENVEGQYAGVITYRALAYMLKERTPTLMPAIERTRLSETGVRGWQTLRQRCGWSGVGELDGINRMDRAMKNVMMVEQKVRQDTSAVMRENISKQLEGKGPNEKPDLRKVTYQEGVNDYRLTKERFEKELTALFTDRKTGQIPESEMQDFEDAKKLYSETRQYLNDDYMNNFAEKLRMNGKPEKYFPFAVAAEELDTSFLTYQSAGPDVMRRALSEIGSIETNVVKNIQDNFVGKFRDVAMHEKKFDPLIHAIHEVHKQLDGIHGEKYANEVADYMARLATAYFKRDSDVVGIFGKVLNVGKPHSIAAEFAGGSWKNVWEWDVAEQESFYRELDKLGILPDRPKNLNKAEVLERKKLFGITWGYSKVQLEDEPGDPEHSGLKIRQEMGATYAQLAWEITRKWLPLVALAISWSLLRKATEEVRGGGNRH